MLSHADGPKSPRKAAFLSLLLPGAGELYAGGGRSARFFFFTEGAFWTGLFAFKALASARESTFKSFAAAHAGAQTEGKQNSFFDELERFQTAPVVPVQPYKAAGCHEFLCHTARMVAGTTSIDLEAGRAHQSAAFATANE